jgi:DNA adenine methylase
MAFDRLFERFRASVLVVSYASNARPVLKEMVALMKKYKRHVEVVPVDYRYCFGNQAPAAGKGRNVVQEYLFVGT